MLKLVTVTMSMAVIAFSLSSCKFNSDSLTKVVGGSAGGPEAVVKISNGRSTCSGTFIHQREMLTAWHCLSNLETGGIIYNGQTSEKVFLKGASPFPANPSPAELGRLMPQDIALVRFATDVAPAVAEIGPRPPAGSSVTMVGFGMTKMSDSNTIGSKNQGQSTVRDHGQVLVDAKGNRIPTIGMITTEGQGVFVQGGDSGGALFYNNKLVGVTSAGPDPEDPLVSLFVDLSTSSSREVLANRLKTERDATTADANPEGACFVVAKSRSETDKRFCRDRKLSACQTRSDRHATIFITTRRCESFKGTQKVVELQELAKRQRDDLAGQSTDTTATTPVNAQTIPDLAIKVREASDHLLVVDVTADGVGARAGLTKDMKIVQVDGIEVSTEIAFGEAVKAAKRAGQDMELAIRDRTASVKIEFPSTDAANDDFISFGEVADDSADLGPHWGRCYTINAAGKFVCSRIQIQDFWCREQFDQGKKVQYWTQGPTCETGTVTSAPVLGDSGTAALPAPTPDP